jgi:threonine aldolase
VIDLRSDTVTHPTPAMRRAMAEAEVGDDVFGEDPTVNRLQEVAAARLGKEAALLVSSGTMGNLLAFLAAARPGDEAIVGDKAHTFNYEGGGMAALAGVQPRVLPNAPDGTLDLDAVAAAVRPDFLTFPRSRMFCLESTHNVCDGRPLELDYMSAARAVADRYALHLHLDGARLFNAAAALQRPVAELARDADSVTFCLSKGLAAPVGSVLCGDAAFIAEARRARKRIGGGMRQAGVLAAAGLVALEEMADRLAQDHARARRLAEGLAEVPGLICDPERAFSNIVYVDLALDGPSPAALAEAVGGQGVRVLPSGPRTLRAVTHYEIDDAAVEAAIEAFGSAASALRLGS